jgi:integrase
MEPLPVVHVSDSSSGLILPGALQHRHPRQDFYDQLSDSTRTLLFQKIPEETRKAYAREWHIFTEWCATQRRNPLPASEADLVEWVGNRINKRDSLTRIGQGIAAVRRIHKEAGYKKQPPSDEAWGLHRQYRVTLLDAGWRPTKSATVTVEQFRLMVATLPADTLSGARDRAILAVGLSGFFRRSNIIRLDIGDVMTTDWGDIQLIVTRSKTDQAAKGRTRTLPPGEDPLSNPVGLLNAWLAALGGQGITEGPLFRAVSKSGRILDRRLNPDWVRLTVKRAAANAGLKSLKHRPYRAHTLRSSGVTAARRAGKSWDLIREAGDWAKDSNVVYGYDQPEEQDNAMRGVL